MKKSHLYRILFLLLTISPIIAQQSYKPFTKEQLKTFVPSGSRFVTSLSGNWERSYDGSVWEVISLPASENEPRKTRYRRSIRMEKDLLNRYTWFLQSLGISEEVELYLNNSYIGRYFAGMSPFSIRLPDSKLNAGVNTLELVVTPSPAFASRHLFSQRAYSGIVRELLLVGNPQVWVDDLHTSLQFGQNFGSCEVKTMITVRSGAIERLTIADSNGNQAPAISLKKVPVTIETVLRRIGKPEILAQGEPKQLDIERDRSINITLPLRIQSPELWSPSNPNLYQLTVRISKGGSIIDDYTLPIGFYTVRTGNNEDKPMIMLNESPFFVKAVDYMEHVQSLGMTMTAEQIEKDVLSLKTLGVNTVRIRYGTPHPYFTELCNINGIFILLDLPAYDFPAAITASDEIMVRMKNFALRTTGAYDRQPCILGYGIADGLLEGDSRTQQYLNTISGELRQLSSKLIYKTVRFGSRQLDDTKTDFIVLRSSPRWEPGDVQRAEIERIRTIAGKKPLLVMFGKPAQPNNLNGYSDPLSVESQAQYVRDSYRTIQQTKSAGIIIWSFSDFITARPIIITHPDNQFLCTSGLSDIQRQPRLAYTMLKALLNEEKEPLLRSGSFSQDTPMIYIGLSILLGLGLFLLMSRFRRFREYIIRALLRPYNFYSDIRDQRILSIVQTIAVGALSSATLAIILSTILYVFRSSFGTEYMYMVLLPTGTLRSLLDTLTWSPELAVFLFTLIGMLAHVIVAGIIQAAALLSRSKIFFTDAITITMWSALPFLLLLPLAIGMFKILAGSGTATWLILILLAMFIWYYYRLLRSTSVVFDLPSIPVYIAGCIVMAGMIAAIMSYYSNKVDVFSYMQYYFSTLS
jgi:beta-galactosidase